ncbi:MAG: hypothetical protein H0W88_03755 [Parachlamydiaceae bacterium]|nr:hypothetical protein [Parachlamydiaceae bacterium]
MSNSIPNISLQINQNFESLAKEVEKDNFKLHWSICSGMVYLSTAILTKIPAFHGLLFVHVAIVIHQITTPLFSFLNDYRDVSLVPFCGFAANAVLTAFISSRICGILYPVLNLKQAFSITVLFLLCLHGTKQLIANSQENQKPIPE